MCCAVVTFRVKHRAVKAYGRVGVSGQLHAPPAVPPGASHSRLVRLGVEKNVTLTANRSQLCSHYTDRANTGGDGRGDNVQRRDGTDWGLIGRRECGGELS